MILHQYAEQIARCCSEKGKNVEPCLRCPMLFGIGTFRGHLGDRSRRPQGRYCGVAISGFVRVTDGVQSPHTRIAWACMGQTSTTEAKQKGTVCTVHLALVDRVQLTRSAHPTYQYSRRRPSGGHQPPMVHQFETCQGHVPEMVTQMRRN